LLIKTKTRFDHRAFLYNNVINQILNFSKKFSIVKLKFSGTLILRGRFNSTCEYEIDGNSIPECTLEELAEDLPVYLLVDWYRKKGFLNYDDFRKVWSEFGIEGGKRKSLSRKLNLELERRGIPTFVIEGQNYISPKIVKRYLKERSIKIVSVPTLVKGLKGKSYKYDVRSIACDVCESYLLRVEEEAARILLEIAEGRNVKNPPRNFFVDPKLKSRLEEYIKDPNVNLKELTKILS